MNQPTTLAEWQDLKINNEAEHDRQLVADLPATIDLSTIADAFDHAKALLEWSETVQRDDYRAKAVGPEYLRMVVAQAQAWLDVASVLKAGL